MVRFNTSGYSGATNLSNGVQAVMSEHPPIEQRVLEFLEYIASSAVNVERVESRLAHLQKEAISILEQWNTRVQPSPEPVPVKILAATCACGRQMELSGNIRVESSPEPEVASDGFVYSASSSDLFKELGMNAEDAESAERGLNAVIRREDMKRSVVTSEIPVEPCPVSDTVAMDAGSSAGRVPARALKGPVVAGSNPAPHPPTQQPHGLNCPWLPKEINEELTRIADTAYAAAHRADMTSKEVTDYVAGTMALEGQGLTGEQIAALERKVADQQPVDCRAAFEAWFYPACKTGEIDSYMETRCYPADVLPVWIGFRAGCQYTATMRESLGCRYCGAEEGHWHSQCCSEYPVQQCTAEHLRSDQPKPADFASFLAEARVIVEASPLFRKFIDGTPLQNDIPVWMAEFAMKGGRP